MSSSEIYLLIDKMHGDLHKLSNALAMPLEVTQSDYSLEYLNGKYKQLVNTANHVKEQFNDRAK